MQDAQKGRPARPQRVKGLRRYIPHFVWAVRLATGIGERKSPSVIPTSERLSFVR